MKSKAKDRRAQKTCAALENAFLELIQTEDLKKITITKVTAKANTNRSTFYLHYYDIYDLLDSVEDKIILQICALISDTNSSSAKIDVEPVLAYIKSNEKLFRVILENDNIFHFFNKLNKMFEEKIITEFFGANGYDLEKSRNLNLFFVGGTVALIRGWLDDGINSMSYEKLAGIIEYIATTFIQAFDRRINS